MRAWKLFILCGAFLILPLAGLAVAAGPGAGADDVYTPTSAAPTSAAAAAAALPTTGSNATLPMFWIGSVAVALGATALFAARRNASVRRRVSA